MLVTMIDDDPFVGRIATGRIASGVVSLNDRVKVITRDGASMSQLCSPFDDADRAALTSAASMHTPFMAPSTMLIEQL